MKKRLVFIILILSFLLVGCSFLKFDDYVPSIYKVAVVIAYDDIDDQSFNQTSYEACKDFCIENRIDFSYYKPINDTLEAREAMIEMAIEDGFNIIILPGYGFVEPVTDLAPKHKDIKFLAIDMSKAEFTENLDPSNLSNYDNLYCISYREEISGFLAGYSAVKLGYRNLGFLGGMDIDAVKRYGYGFIQGCDLAANELGEDIKIKYAYTNTFSGATYITNAMKSWYKSGTEVVFSCGGNIYTSVAEAASYYDKKIIGVDVDQAPIIDNAYGEKLTVTSAMKGIYPSIFNTLTEIVIKNKWNKYAGKFDNLGLISASPILNYCQIPIESTQFNDLFKEEDYYKLVSNIYSNNIIISNKINAPVETTNASVEYLDTIE